jgi:hypothetical protein
MLIQSKTSGMGLQATLNTLNLLQYRISRVQATIDALDMTKIDEATVQVHNDTLNDLLESHQTALASLRNPSPDGFSHFIAESQQFKAIHEACVEKLGALSRLKDAAAAACAINDQTTTRTNNLVPSQTPAPHSSCPMTDRDAASTQLNPTKMSILTSPAVPPVSASVSNCLPIQDSKVRPAARILTAPRPHKTKKAFQLQRPMASAPETGHTFTKNDVKVSPDSLNPTTMSNSMCTTVDWATCLVACSSTNKRCQPHWAPTITNHHENITGTKSRAVADGPAAVRPGQQSTKMLPCHNQQQDCSDDLEIPVQQTRELSSSTDWDPDNPRAAHSTDQREVKFQSPTIICSHIKSTLLFLGVKQLLRAAGSTANTKSLADTKQQSMLHFKKLRRSTDQTLPTGPAGWPPDAAHKFGTTKKFREPRAGDPKWLGSTPKRTNSRKAATWNRRRLYGGALKVPKLRVTERLKPVRPSNATHKYQQRQFSCRTQKVLPAQVTDDLSARVLLTRKPRSPSSRRYQSDDCWP